MSSMGLPGMGGDFAKGVSGAPAVYDTSPTGLGLSPAYLAPSSTATATASTSTWITADYKVSAVGSDHADPGGGMWLICDGTAIAAQYTGLIATIGVNRPDARGRTLVMQGTNAAVSTLLANDGVAVANRRPQHRHTPHTHTLTNVPDYATAGASPSQWQPGVTNVTPVTATGSKDGGSGTATDSLDAPAFVVPGNLFIHT